MFNSLFSWTANKYFLYISSHFDQPATNNVNKKELSNFLFVLSDPFSSSLYYNLYQSLVIWCLHLYGVIKNNLLTIMPHLIIKTEQKSDHKWFGKVHLAHMVIVNAFLKVVIHY